jgi:hypothetical protein
MSITKRVEDSLEKFQAGDAESALFQILSAVEATANTEFGGHGRSNFKRFIHENLRLITRVSMNPLIENLNIAFTHPNIDSKNGLCTIQDVIYHAARCGLYHDAQLPTNLEFTNENKIASDSKKLTLPSSLIAGIIASVVVSPSNAGCKLSKEYQINKGSLQVSINNWWGKRQDFKLWLNVS